VVVVFRIRGNGDSGLGEVVVCVLGDGGVGGCGCGGHCRFGGDAEKMLWRLDMRVRRGRWFMKVQEMQLVRLLVGARADGRGTVFANGRFGLRLSLFDAGVRAEEWFTRMTK